MKLRLKGSSLRLRVARSELSHLQAGKSIQERVQLSLDSRTYLDYVLTVGRHEAPVQVSFAAQRILVSISEDQLTGWSGEDQVGIYSSLPVAEANDLEVSIEKDFACLDLSDEENKDTFENPMAARAC